MPLFEFFAFSAVISSAVFRFIVPPALPEVWSLDVFRTWRRNDQRFSFCCGVRLRAKHQQKRVDPQNHFVPCGRAAAGQEDTAAFLFKTSIAQK